MSSLVEELRAVVGGDACLTRPEELFVYECDALTLDPVRPAAVVLPQTTEQVVAVVQACRRYGQPFVPRGAGTGLSGGAHPTPGAGAADWGRAFVRQCTRALTVRCSPRMRY